MEEILTNRVDDLIKQADDSLIKFIKEGKYQDVLLNMSNLSNYSMRNQILIYIQNPEATHVNGMKAWNYYGRSVKKGEKSMKVIAPIIEKVEIHEDSAYEGPDQEPKYKQVVTGFKVSFVFDITQTDGKEIQKFDSTEEIAREHFEIYKKALESCVKNYKFEYGEIEGTSDGYCDYKNRVIKIKEGMPTEKTLTTLIHEIGHALAEDRDRTNFKGLTPLEQRKIREIEAESIALVVSNKLGLHTDEFNCSYITAWSDGDIEKFRANIDVIRSVSYQIISKIEPEIESGMKLEEINKQEQEKQKVLDKFYADMDFGADSNLVSINKITDNKVYYSLNGTAGVYDIVKEEEKEQEQPKETTTKKTKQTKKKKEAELC